MLRQGWLIRRRSFRIRRHDVPIVDGEVLQLEELVM